MFQLTPLSPSVQPTEGMGSSGML